MFADVESHIESRFHKILFEGVPLKTYSYEPDRDKGYASYPCAAFRLLYYKEDISRARPNCEIWVPDEEEETVTFPVPTNMGGETELTGPVQWTKKPYPTPYDLGYEVHLIATSRAHIHSLMLAIPQCFPIGYMPMIGEEGRHSYPLFSKSAPTDDDDLTLPRFEKIFLLWVEGVWIYRLEEQAHSSITTPELDSEIEYEPYQ